MRGLGRLTSGVERQDTVLAPGKIRASTAHETAGRRQTCSHASRTGTTCRSRLAATGKSVQAPTNSQSCPPMWTSTRKSQRRMAPTLRRPVSEPSPGNGHEMTGSPSTMSDMNHVRRRIPMSAHHRLERTTANAQVRRCPTMSAVRAEPCQTPHARATSCLVSTCRQVRW